MLLEVCATIGSTLAERCWNKHVNSQLLLLMLVLSLMLVLPLMLLLPL